MKFAVIPWSENELNDQIFYVSDKNGKLVPTPSAAYLMVKEFERLGHEVHTIDLFPDLCQVDYFLLYVIDWGWVKKIVAAGLESRMVYCNAEPPSVSLVNSPEGFKILKRYFPYIMTWNPDWVDDERIFLRCIPYYFDFKPCRIAFENRKLITAISANKTSKWSDELYSERERAYFFFEKNYPDDFDFYGVGWEGTEHPCYRGRIRDKKEIFHKYKFAICFENMRSHKNYITEKIWDCLNSQIVPIYLGAKNVTDYIPRECFIDFNDFESYDTLANYLVGMTEERYNKYLEAARALLDSDVTDFFRGEQYAHDFLEAVKHSVSFTMGVREKIYVYCKGTMKELFGR
ncbi:MAG: glycosyltransferase family 10 [Lachnospiraceae bacterium]|nr:glycosyltransferase family 10 [Lachnospiraceae bacterium]